MNYSIEDLIKINDFLKEQPSVPFTHSAPKKATAVEITREEMAWITEYTSHFPKLEMTPGGNVKKVATINSGYYIKASSSSIELHFLRFGTF